VKKPSIVSTSSIFLASNLYSASTNHSFSAAHVSIQMALKKFVEKQVRALRRQTTNGNMPFEIPGDRQKMEVVTGERSATDPNARALLAIIAGWERELGLSDAHVFFDFPLYRDDERLVQCEFLLVSKSCGVILAGISNIERGHEEALLAAEGTLDVAFGQLMARFVKNPKLRHGPRNLRFPFEGFLFAPDFHSDELPELQLFQLISSAGALREFLQEKRSEKIPDDVFQEILATIEGAKGLIRPKERSLKTFGADSKAALVTKLEEEINRFDRDQVQGYLPSLDGVQRIRGLAGSGKTVVLAMRAALLHLKNPDDRIALTFYTKSLYQHVKRLITRFYRQYDDQDPNWEKVHVLHAWGGKSNPGIYFNACLNNGVQPLTYGDAANSGAPSPFDFVCSTLLNARQVRAEYDHVLVDEAQDFPPSFLRLCYALAREGRLTFAYDQLQTIFQAEPPGMQEIFGVDDRGEPIVRLKDDTVLHRCYRNPLEITVCAHALGFGIYGDRIVQMLENEEHWNDLGYEVVTGRLVTGAETEIRRSADSSPSSISSMSKTEEIVSAHVYSDLSEEVAEVVNGVCDCIRVQGLRPDDVLIIAADDRNSKTYFSAIAQALQKRGIDTNNLQLDKYSIQDFVRDNTVTLSTIHKAKGNEAYQVFIVGIDALFSPVTVRRRNMVFTAMTRAKAWLRVSGIGQFALVFKRELDEAVRNLPALKFRYPSREDLQFMRRDLRDSPEQKAERILREVRELLSEDEYYQLLQQNLDLKKGESRGNAKRPTSKRDLGK
jgi:superfamily I DNA and RNA helicase